MYFLRRFAVCLLLMGTLSMLAGCASHDKDKPVAEVTAESLYQQADEAMAKELYKTATGLYEKVEQQFPYSELATKAQVMAALASYRDERYDDAIIALDRFIQLHPGMDNLDYAYYLKALCHYDQIADVRRDQSITREALADLEALIKRFPNSDYRRDAELKRDLTLDHLAGKEMEVGRYYLNRGYINAAINRFLIVVKDYQTTTHVPEALHRLVEAYLTLGMKAEAYKVAAVLGHNYPGSQWYERSYDLMDDASRQALIDGQSTWDKTINAIFKPD